jgi:hypothetical protein
MSPAVTGRLDAFGACLMMQEHVASRDRRRDAALLMLCSLLVIVQAHRFKVCSSSHPFGVHTSRVAHHVIYCRHTAPPPSVPLSSLTCPATARWMDASTFGPWAAHCECNTESKIVVRLVTATVRVQF